MKKIIILTSVELRHKFFRIFLSNYKNIEVLKTFSEKGWTLENHLNNKNFKSGKLINEHTQQRHKTEKMFFDQYCEKTEDKSNNFFCEKDFISQEKCLDDIKQLSPDLIVVYGTSLLKGEIIEEFKNKILNVHLGLSPYYRGSGSNYFPFVNNEPEYAGVTYMFIDDGIDTGNIIHQIRPNINENDSFHEIGTKLILDMARVYAQLITSFEKIKIIDKEKMKKENHFYKRDDFTSDTVEKMRNNFKNGIIKKYLKNKFSRDKNVPIIQQDWIK